jgi:hypothetical protein
MWLKYQVNSDSPTPHKFEYEKEKKKETWKLGKDHDLAESQLKVKQTGKNKGKYRLVEPYNNAH